MTSGSEQFLTLAQAAALLGLCRQRLQSLVRHGALTVVQRDTTLRGMKPHFRRAEVEALAASEAWQKRQRASG